MRPYLVTWLLLLVLTVVSWQTATLDLAGFDAAVMLAIATVKATLVVLFFMHLAHARFANKMVVIVSALFVVLLVSLTAADVATRHTYPPGSSDIVRP
jgi:cytochrome c oxidase subunit IV